jgi:hypothetical protein
MKRGETDEDFQLRIQAAAAEPKIRTVGRASHETLSKQNSFLLLRKRCAAAVADLGIEYGDDRQPDSRSATTNREFQAQQFVEHQAKMATERDEADRIKVELDARKVELDARDVELEAKGVEQASVDVHLHEREDDVLKDERRIYRLKTVINKLISKAANILNVSAVLSEIVTAINEYTNPELETEPDIEETPPEDEPGF